MNALIGLLASTLLLVAQPCLAAESGHGPTGAEKAACPVIYPDRIWLRGFSVQPPVGDHWCLDLTNDNSAVINWRDDTWEDQNAHRFMIWAHLDDVDGGSPTSMTELTAFAKAWVKAGAISIATPSGRARLTLQATEAPSGMKLRRGSAEADATLGAPCVRYDLEYDRWGHARFPGKMLTAQAKGFLCLNLLDPDELIDLSYMERSASDERPAIAWIEELKPEAEAFFRSIWIGWPRDEAEIERYRTSANEGWVQAQFGLAVHFQLDEEYVQAAKWFRAAAEKGHSGAQHDLGVMYRYGLGGLPLDPRLAARWFREAAVQGVRDAQFLLATLCLSGEGVPKDVAAAMRWARRAADQGVGAAQVMLGAGYQLGRGVPQDCVRAYIWLRLGLSRVTDADDRKAADQLLKSISLALTPDQLLDAERRWAVWRPGKE